MRFEFATATRILVGPGTVAEAPAAAASLGRRALIVTGRNPDRAARLLDLLGGAGVATCSFAIAGEPTTDDVLRGVAQARHAECDLVIGFGGGAALDSAKAIAALLTNPGDLFDYLEVIGRGAALQHPSAPCITIPTTAGTGSEVTRNAVLASPQHRVKVSLRSPLMLPRLAIVDAELTYDLPPALTASTGLDALTQLIEPFVCSRANPLTDALCRDGIPWVARSLRIAVREGTNAAARADMSLASLHGGLALANAGLGAVHGLAGPIGGMFPAPHGAVCGVLLPSVMQANLDALCRRMPANSEALQRFNEVARLLTGDATARAEDGVRWVKDLVAELGVPRLGTYGISTSDFAAIAQAAVQASSMKANPVTLSSAELEAILQQAT